MVALGMLSKSAYLKQARVTQHNTTQATEFCLSALSASLCASVSM